MSYPEHWFLILPTHFSHTSDFPHEGVNPNSFTSILTPVLVHRPPSRQSTSLAPSILVSNPTTTLSLAVRIKWLDFYDPVNESVEALEAAKRVIRPVMDYIREAKGNLSMIGHADSLEKTKAEAAALLGV